MYQKKIYIFFILLLFIGACKPKPQFDVDLSKVEEVNIKIKRYDRALFALDANNLRKGLDSIKTEFSFFISDKLDTFDILSLRNYITDPAIIKTSKDIIEKYPDLKNIENDLSLALRHFKYYFPDKKVTEVYTYLSGFDFENPVKYVDSTLIVALDMYLGADYYFYPMIGIPDYKAYRMRKESVVVDCMNEIGKCVIPPDRGQFNFLDKMIYEGKLLYFLDITLPNVQDSIKIGFKTSQIDWCIKNEGNMWGFIMEQNFLYNNDKKIISRFMDDGPYTPSFEEASPARTGAYVGWQIVRAYMTKNKVKVKELFMTKDSQMILNNSKYKPKK